MSWFSSSGASSVIAISSVSAGASTFSSTISPVDSSPSSSIPNSTFSSTISPVDSSPSSSGSSSSSLGSTGSIRLIGSIMIGSKSQSPGLISMQIVTVGTIAVSYTHLTLPTTPYV